MKIVNNIDKRVEFAHIKVGECFLYDNCLFVRINPVKNNEHAANAYCFVDNNIMCVPKEYQVIPVDAEVIIRSRGVQ